MIRRDNMSDWRLHGQERYLMDLELYWRKYTRYSDSWDHDHCEFCGETFSLYGGDLTEGYSTKDSYYWICKQCHDDFCNLFNWKHPISD